MTCSLSNKKTREFQKKSTLITLNYHLTKMSSFLMLPISMNISTNSQIMLWDLSIELCGWRCPGSRGPSDGRERSLQTRGAVKTLFVTVNRGFRGDAM